MLSMYMNLSSRSLYQIGRKRLLVNLIILGDGLFKLLAIALSLYFRFDVVKTICFVGFSGVTFNYLVLILSRFIFLNNLMI